MTKRNARATILDALARRFPSVRRAVTRQIGANPLTFWEPVADVAHSHAALLSSIERMGGVRRVMRGQCAESMLDEWCPRPCASDVDVGEPN